MTTRLRSIRVGDAVMLEWEDSCCASGWKEDEELHRLDASGCVSVGWVVRKTARTVTVAPHVGVNSGVALRQTNGHMMIPLAAIRRVVHLRLPKLDRVRAAV